LEIKSARRVEKVVIAWVRPHEKWIVINPTIKGLVIIGTVEGTIAIIGVKIGVMKMVEMSAMYYESSRLGETNRPHKQAQRQ
jgi:hypothetical protein